MASTELPIITLDPDAGESFREDLKNALSGAGAFYLKAPEIVSSGFSLLARAKELFALEEDTKKEFLLDKKDNFSGYSLLKNKRDHREQYHLFTGIGNSLDHPLALMKKPNLPPHALSSEWKDSVEAYMDKMVLLARFLLVALLGQENSLVDTQTTGAQSYSLLKLIHYLARQESETNVTGTPEHIDWSYLTLVMQDEMPGLSLWLEQKGCWVDVEMIDDCIIVLAGELLELVTRNQVRACPHRVILPASVQERFSAPFFYCPDLDCDLEFIDSPSEDNPSRLPKSLNDNPHVHRVFNLDEVDGSIGFGATEFNRKDRGRWCYKPSCCRK